MIGIQFNFRQSGVIPYRLNNGNMEVLLITSVRKKKWIIPKGYVEFNLSPFESAKKEAYEEAGIKGTNETIELGSFRTHKEIGICMVRVYSMEVLEMLENYPEKERRKRKWFTVEEASEVVSIPEVSQMIKDLKIKVQSA